MSASLRVKKCVIMKIMKNKLIAGVLIVVIAVGLVFAGIELNHRHANILSAMWIMFVPISVSVAIFRKKHWMVSFLFTILVCMVFLASMLVCRDLAIWVSETFRLVR